MSNYFDASGTIGFTCDNCGREVAGCTFVNGMRFCAKCYQETFGASKDWQLLDKDRTIAEQRKQIADLEAKLAESEERVKDLEFRNKNLEHSLKVAPNANAGQRQRIVELKEINHKLKQQLAEKEAERELDNAFWKQECDSLQKALAEKDKEIKTMQESSDKNIDYLIEFASLIENQKDCNRMLKALEMVKTGKKYIVDKEHQNKISFALEQLQKVKKKILSYEEIYYQFLESGAKIHVVCVENFRVRQYIDQQIEELKEGK